MSAYVWHGSRTDADLDRFEADHCAECACPIGAFLTHHENEYGAEYERAEFHGYYMNGDRRICEDCYDEAL